MKRRLPPGDIGPDGRVLRGWNPEIGREPRAARPGKLGAIIDRLVMRDYNKLSILDRLVMLCMGMLLAGVIYCSVVEEEPEPKEAGWSSHRHYEIIEVRAEPGHEYTVTRNLESGEMVSWPGVAGEPGHIIEVGPPADLDD